MAVIASGRVSNGDVSVPTPLAGALSSTNHTTGPSMVTSAVTVVHCVAGGPSPLSQIV